MNPNRRTTEEQRQLERMVQAQTELGWKQLQDFAEAMGELSELNA